MKIINVATQWVQVPYARPFYPTWFPGRSESHQNILLVRLKTDEGLEGWGSMECPFNLTPTYMEMIKGLIEPWMIGQDPLMIERLATKLKGDGRMAGRPWVVENALWDLMGKVCNQPAYKVLGAYRDKIPAYAAWTELRSLEERAEEAQRLVEEGFKAVKVRLFRQTLKEDLAEVECIRKVVGDKLTIMADANQGVVRDRNFERADLPVWSYQRALETARELHQLGVLWLEEPLDHYDYHGLSRLTAATDIAIGGGEIMNGINDHQVLIENDCYDIVMPNCTLCGGFSQVRKIAALAERHGNKPCNIHGWVPGVGVAACVALICSYPNATWLEYPYDPPTMTPDNFQGIIKEPLAINKEDGCLHAPNKPGFGVELDEEKIKRYLVAEL